ncbi:MAG: SWF/SNF helicase family protein [Planctomycetes bacterium]|nr:SWF/SNF helicase family protein [Planctomycetota bacterium]
MAANARLLVQRIEHRGWQHALFRGGVPGNQRPARLDRFRSDEKYRAFLSTDAGDGGRNLQHAASVVVTLELSWSPAVLEQRIGRRSPVGPVAGGSDRQFRYPRRHRGGHVVVLPFTNRTWPTRWTPVNRKYFSVVRGATSS